MFKLSDQGVISRLLKCLVGVNNDIMPTVPAGFGACRMGSPCRSGLVRQSSTSIWPAPGPKNPGTPAARVFFEPASPAGNKSFPHGSIDHFQAMHAKSAKIEESFLKPQSSQGAQSQAYNSATSVISAISVVHPIKMIRAVIQQVHELPYFGR